MIQDSDFFTNRPDEPIDPHNPFRNPTENHAYAPDYTRIVPQIETLGCQIPLQPAPHEKKKIRHYFTLAGTLGTANYLLAGLFVSLFFFLAEHLLKIVDSTKLSGVFPQNYSSICNSYFDDTSISIGITLLSFLFANTIIFFLGCKLSRFRVSAFFNDKNLSVMTIIRYIFVGLWLQLAAGCLSNFLIRIGEETGNPFNTPDMSVGNSTTKMLLTVLYGCLVAPITEELVYRGVLLKNFSRVSQRFGIFLSAFFFALAHENLAQGILAFILGIFLAYIAIENDSLVPSMIVHFSINTVSIVGEILMQYLPNTSEKIDTIYLLTVLLFGTLCFFYTILSERLPASTPHQTFRGLNIALTSVGVWLFAAAHLISIYLPTIYYAISRFLAKG